MSEFGSEVSSSEVSGDSGTTSDVSEVDTGSEVSESEMDEDLIKAYSVTQQIFVTDIICLYMQFVLVFF